MTSADRVAVVGTGLIGTSVAMAAERVGDAVRGFDTDADALARAAERSGLTPSGTLGECVAGATVAGWKDDASGLPLFQAVTDEHGDYAIAGLEPGAIRVKVEGERLVQANDPVPLLLVAGGEVRQDFELHAGTSVSGVVLDAGTGLPIAGISIQSRKPPGRASLSVSSLIGRAPFPAPRVPGAPARRRRRSTRSARRGSAPSPHRRR